MTTTVETTRGSCPLCGFGYSGTKLGCGPDFEYRTTGSQEFCFIKCETCGIVVLDPRPVDEAIHRLYPQEYEPYRFSQLPPPVRLARDLVQRSKADTLLRLVPESGALVDVGCGAGALLRSLRARSGSQRLALIGWDYPAPHLNTLRDEGFAVIAAPIEEAHVPAGINVFVLNQVIEHLAEPARILTMLRAALLPEGVVVIETPNTDSFDARLFQARYWGGYHIPRHLTLFDSVNLKTLLDRCGFTVIEQTFLASPAFWVQSFHHLLLESRFRQLARLFSLRNAPLVAAVTLLDMVRAGWTSTSNQRVIARVRS